MSKKNKVGRPTTYNREIAEEICSTIASTELSIKRLCELNNHWPDKSTILLWRIQVKEFSDLYAVAKQHQVEALVDEILEIADDKSNDYTTNDEGKTIYNTEHINRSRLRIDSRKWLAGKLAPRIYGDSLRHEGFLGIKHEDAIKELE